MKFKYLTFGHTRDQEGGVKCNHCNAYLQALGNNDL